MELCGYETYGRQVKKFYRIYEKKISEQHLRVSKLREQRVDGTKETPGKGDNED